jgi:hypothetical protein
VLSSAAIGNVNGEHARVPVIIPAHTAIRVFDRIDANSARPGARFRGKLGGPAEQQQRRRGDSPKSFRPVIVANVKESNRISGRGKIDLKVNAIMFNGKSYPVATTIAGLQGGGKGSRTLRKTGVGAGAGALIGGITGGGTGAAVGAPVGTGGGTAVPAATSTRRFRLRLCSLFGSIQPLELNSGGGHRSIISGNTVRPPSSGQRYCRTRYHRILDRAGTIASAQQSYRE